MALPVGYNIIDFELNISGIDDYDFSKRRKILRDQVIELFLKEPHGRGTGEEASRWVYKVENSIDNRFIYLKRPALLNKGVDFEVHASEKVFFVPTDLKPSRIYTRPKHKSLCFPINAIRSEHKKEYDVLVQLLQLIYFCKDYSDFVNKNKSMLEKNISYNHNESEYIEIDYLTIAQTIKWLFIEQDVTYWNWSGRAKYWKCLSECYPQLQINSEAFQ